MYLIPIRYCFVIINNYTFIIHDTIVLFHAFGFNVFGLRISRDLEWDIH
jgi:hypothetical protein